MTRAQIKVAALSAVLTIVLMVALVLALKAFVRPGDPGERLFDIRLINDTSHEVIVQTPCTDDVPPCEYTNYRDIAPGTSASVVTADGNQDQKYRVVTTSGEAIGCLPLKFPTVESGATVWLSKALAPCS
jgi:hypothetical protein